MLSKSINMWVPLISGICLIALGICLFFINELTLKVLLLLFGWMTILFGSTSFIRALLREYSSKKFQFVFSLEGIGDLLIGLFILFFSDFILHSFAVCFGIYLLLHVIINLIQYMIYQKNQIRERYKILFVIVFQLIFFIPLFFNANENIQVTSIILGVYLIGLGLTQLTDFLTILIPKRTVNQIKRQVNIPLPVILNAFFPKKLVTLFHDMLEDEQDVNIFNYKKHSTKPDIYVLIHLAPSGTAAMGHMEIAFEGNIYSYGNYDMHSRSLFDMVGDGVVLVANQEDYIRYVVTKKDRYVVEFGLSLTKKELEVAKKQLSKLIHTNTSPYYTDLELYDKGLLPKGEYHDMSSELYRYASGKFYKIINGKYKKYFVLKTNCAMVVQYVLSSIGKQILCINGILTPGAYYDYLNARFKLKNTNVVSRRVYTKEDFKKKQE